MRPDWSTIDLPSSATVAQYREQGWWREQTFVDDLARWAATRPDHPAVVSTCAGQEPDIVTYAEMLGLVERYAAALVDLGTRRGDIVATWLPNTWELSVLYLAAARIGAVISPVMPVLGSAEATHVLTASGAAVCVTVGTYGERRCAQLLRDAAPESLETLVVLDPDLMMLEQEGGPRVLDFASVFEGDVPEVALPAPVGPDDPAVVLYTSGTSGTMKAVVHSPSTIYSAVRSVSVPHRLGEDDVIFLPGYQSHMAGMTYGIFMSLHLGATNVVLRDNTDRGRMVDELADRGVTWFYAAPVFVDAAVAEQSERPRDTSALVRIVTGSAPVQPRLVEDVRRAFGAPLHSLWGMSENGAVTLTVPEDPDDWAAHSDGRAMPWMEWRIDELPQADGGRLLVRGANQCFGYLGQRETYTACLDAEGWFDTGDLAVKDSRGGIRIVGRRDDLITRSLGWGVSVLQVEAVLAEHPAVKDVALVGYPDPDQPRCDLVCAVVVPEGTPITLEDMHAYLDGLGMSRLQWPDRVQFQWQLPRNSVGKVMRRPLRRRLELEAGL